RLLLPRILDAVGDVAETPEAETLDVDVVIARDAAAAVDALKNALKGERVSLEARWAGAAGRSSVTGLAISTGSDPTHIAGDLLADTNVPSAVSALDSRTGPALVIHRAKELMHGLGLAFPTLERDTAVMAYLLDPGEGKYLLEDLALRYLSLELTSPDQVEGTLDFDGEANARDTGRRVAVLMRLADALAEALGARELVSLSQPLQRPRVSVL